MSGEKADHNCESCIVAWKNFRNLTGDELKLVNESRYEATFKPGEIIIKQGSPAASAVFLASGLGKVYIEGLDSKNFILGFAMPSNLLLGPGVFVLRRHSYSVAALSIVHTCFINFDLIVQLIKQNPAFAMGMLEDISMKSYNVHRKLLSLTQKKMPGRIAEALLVFSDNVFKTDEFDMILSRQELGEMTSMAKESVVRILKELEGTGVIEAGYSKIKILDKDKLRLISERG